MNFRGKFRTGSLFLSARFGTPRNRLAGVVEPIRMQHRHAGFELGLDGGIARGWETDGAQVVVLG